MVRLRLESLNLPARLKPKIKHSRHLLEHLLTLGLDLLNALPSILVHQISVLVVELTSLFSESHLDQWS